LTDKIKMNMKQQIVLITGALAGIGRATAFAFAAEGAKLVVSGRQEEAGLALEKELRQQAAALEGALQGVRVNRAIVGMGKNISPLSGSKIKSYFL
jgi:NADP-dependent 3-hydroxy acid dehydrogenase YdfG